MAESPVGQPVGCTLAKKGSQQSFVARCEKCNLLLCVLLVDNFQYNYYEL